MSMSKHVINAPKSLVLDSLKGVACNPSLEIQGTSVFLKEVTPRVHLISGGGSGHEPHVSAMVGVGGLSGAVCGQVFASPNSGQVTEALLKLSAGTGTLMIVKNYTGDVLQFGLAAERWAASNAGKEIVKIVVVGEDVAVPKSQGALTGRRGLAGTVLVYKIAGELAARGASLDECEHIASLISNSCGTIGMGLDHCHVAGNAASEAYLKSDEMELGMGIHNEPGIQKISPIPSAEKLTDQMLGMITNTTDAERSFLPFKNDGKDSVILLVNNLGGLPGIELALLVNEALAWCEKKNITVERVISGSLMSSLNLPGFSFTLLLLPRAPVVPTNFESKLSFDTNLILDCFDAKSQIPAWPFTYPGRPQKVVVQEAAEVKISPPSLAGPAPSDGKKFLAMIKAAVEKVIEAEPFITRCDTIAGDGDAGMTLKSGGDGILAALEAGTISSKDTVAAIFSIGQIVSRDMGGTSGGLYAILLSALTKGLLEAAKDQHSKIATAQVWARALELALNSLYQYTLARPPSRTLVDPLASFILTFAADPTNFDAAFDAAEQATDVTRLINATAGRAAYMDQGALANANVPDAGAHGVLCMLEGIKSVL